MALEARENSRDALTRFRLPNLKITLKLKSKITSQSCFAVAELYCRSGMKATALTEAAIFARCASITLANSLRRPTFMT